MWVLSSAVSSCQNLTRFYKLIAPSSYQFQEDHSPTSHSLEGESSPDPSGDESCVVQRNYDMTRNDIISSSGISQSAMGLPQNRPGIIQLNMGERFSHFNGPQGFSSNLALGGKSTSWCDEKLESSLRFPMFLYLLPSNEEANSNRSQWCHNCTIWIFNMIFIFSTIVYVCVYVCNSQKSKHSNSELVSARLTAKTRAFIVMETIGVFFAITRDITWDYEKQQFISVSFC